MKNLSKIICIVFVISGLLACSGENKKETVSKDVQEVVMFDDGNRKNKEGEIIVDDKNQIGKNVKLVKRSSEDQKYHGKDGSEFKLMSDGFGNKTITRFFDNHPLINCIITRILAKGEIVTYIYSNDGKVKTFNEKNANLINLQTAGEIARNAGIFILRENNFYYAQKAKTAEQNLLLSSFPVYNSNIPENNEPKATFNNFREENVETENTVEETPQTKMRNNTFLEEFDKKTEKLTKNINPKID